MVLSAGPRTGGAGTGNILRSPALAFVGIGWFLATAILLPTLAGVWADRRFDTDPWITLAGLTVGLLAGLRGAYRQLQDVLRQRREPSDENGGESH